MSIIFYAQKGTGAETTSLYRDPAPVMDARSLYLECQKLGLDTDWWFPLANTVTMRAGEESNTAYLLLTKKYIDGCTAEQNAGTRIYPIDRALYNNKISLIDVYIASTVDCSGFVYLESRAIDGSSDPDDLDAVYLVTFGDLRAIWSTQPVAANVSGGLLTITNDSYNITSTTRDDTGMTYDPGVVDDFPYDLSTVGDVAPYSWEDILRILWYEHSYINTTGVIMGFLDMEYPDGGVYPVDYPIDIRPENSNTWHFFCLMLHASGNEIYPNKDGTFRIQPIDDHFGNESDLTDNDQITYSDYLIENGYPDPDDSCLPTHITMTFQVRSRGDSELHLPPGDETNRNHYYTIDRPFETNPSSAYPSGYDSDVVPLLSGEEITASEVSIREGVDGLGDGNILGQVENILSPGMTAVFQVGSLMNGNTLISYAGDILRRLIKSRADNQIDATYGCFIDLDPTPEFEEISWFIGDGGPSTRFLSKPSNVGVSSLPLITGGGSLGTGEDRLFAADVTDDTPGTFEDKVEHKQASGTYAMSPTDWQHVYYEITTVGSDPDKDNTLHLYTASAPGGGVGPPGPPGADGPTYTDGCGIIIAGTVVSFDPTDVVGKGLQVDPYATTTCSMAVKPDDLVGCGLQVASDNAANSAVKIKIKPADLVGCGLEVDPDNTDLAAGGCKIKVKPSDLAGCGLAVSSDANGNDKCKLVIDLDAITNPTTGIGKLAGDQADDNGPCKLTVVPNVTIKVPTSIEINLVGTTLEVKLNYTNYNVYGVVGASSSMNDTVDTTICPS